MKNKRFVLDVNTLISAFLLHENSTAARAWYKAQKSGNIVMSEDTFNEFCDVFVRPKFDRYLSLTKRLVIIEDIKAVVDIVSITSTISACRDPKDNKFLELAVDAGASCIITGDKDLLILHPFNNIPVLTAADFLANF